MGLHVDNLFSSGAREKCSLYFICNFALTLRLLKKFFNYYYPAIPFLGIYSKATQLKIQRERERTLGC